MWNIAVILFQDNLDIYFVFKEHCSFLTTQNPALQPNRVVFIPLFVTPKVRMKQNMTYFPSWLYCPLFVRKKNMKNYIWSQESFWLICLPMYYGICTLGFTAGVSWVKRLSEVDTPVQSLFKTNKGKWSQEISPACCPRKAETWDIWSCSHNVLTTECSLCN